MTTFLFVVCSLVLAWLIGRWLINLIFESAPLMPDDYDMPPPDKRPPHVDR